MALISQMAEDVILLDHRCMTRERSRAFVGAMESRYRDNGCKAVSALRGKSFVTCE